MDCLQNLFAIEPYHANTTIEGWFGILTLLIAVVINATMLSKILEIWTAFNKAQNDRDESKTRISLYEDTSYFVDVPNAISFIDCLAFQAACTN